MVAVGDDRRVSSVSGIVAYRPPPHPFPLLSPTLLGANYTPVNVRVLHVQPTSALLAWNPPINHSSIEVWNNLVHISSLTNIYRAIMYSYHLLVRPNLLRHC